MARKNSAKKYRKTNGKTPGIGLEREVVSSIIGVILLALAVVVILAQLGVTKGWFAGWLERGTTLLFGSAAFIFPLILVLAALFMVVSQKERVVGSAIIGGAVLLLSALGLISVFGSGLSAEQAGGRVGGWVGFAVSWPFERALGFWGALVFFVAFFVSGLLITFRIPLRSYARDVFLPGKEDEEERIGTVVEKGLIGTLTDVARKVSGKNGEVKVNMPVTAPKKETTAAAVKEPAPFNILPLAKDYAFPPLDLLDEESGSPLSGDIKANAFVIQKTLENFGIPVEMGEVNVGPSVTQFTLKPATGIKLSKLTVLTNDLSLALAAHPIRIEAPIPGRSLVGIEIPNKRSMLVRLKSMLEGFDAEERPTALNLAVGRDVAGAPFWATLTAMPHLLVAGATGTGKSVAINAMLLTFLFQHAPEVLRLILIDPKRVELTLYDGIPHLLTPVIIEPKKAIASLKWSVAEMERRYDELSKAGVRDIAGFNAKVASRKNVLPAGRQGGDFMPYIVIVIDELADLMAAYGREIEGAIVRLAQMARAVGIHLVVSTQRPSVEVITGLIKANITSRVAFQVASQIDSRTILDSSGAEKLLGRGDMLFTGAEFSKPKRFQGTYVSEHEVKKVVGFVKKNAAETETAVTEEAAALEGVLANSKTSPINLEEFSQKDDYDDELYPEAKKTVFAAGKASASLLQRRLRVGYARAARLLDMLEERGVIGPGDGAKPREVFGRVSEGVVALEHEDKAVESDAS